MQRLAIAIALVTTMASGAGAQPAPVPPAEADRAAKARAASAKAAFDRGDYAVAVEEYREAYRLVPSPGLLYNLGQAYRLLGACAEAAEAYREYLRLVPDSPYRATAEQNLAAAEVCARDAVAAAERREEERRAAEAAAAATPATITPAPPPVEDRGRGLRLAGMGATAAGAVLVVAGAYFAVDAARQADEVSELYERGGAWQDIADADERGRRSQLLSRVAFGAGGVAIVSGATLYVLGRRADERSRRVVTVTPRAGGAQVVMSWRF